MKRRENSWKASFGRRRRWKRSGGLAGGVAHDFNNLLTIIRGHSEMLLDRLSRRTGHRNVEQNRQAADRAAALTRQMLAFSRKQVLQPSLDLNALVAEMEKLLADWCARTSNSRCTWAIRSGESESRPGQIEQVLLNLTVNARDAMPKGGKLTIETTDVSWRPCTADPADVPRGSYVMLALPNRAGMDEATKARIFEPFFTTKGAGQRNRAGAGDGLRRCEAERRIYLGGVEPRQRVDI